MNLYTYSGPVMLFDECVAYKWTGQTRAISEKKARNNLIFQFKKSMGWLADTKVSLPGKVVLVN